MFARSLIALALALPFAAQAACNFQIANDATKVTWTAYKTKKKVAVGGEFKKFTITPGKNTASVNGLIEGATFTIDTASSTTGNPARDKTITDNFFTVNKKPLTVTGTVTKVSDTSVTAKMMINGNAHDVVFAKTETGDVTKLSADVNMTTVSLTPNFEGISKACKALHEGVTWPDVNMSVEFKTTKACK